MELFSKEYDGESLYDVYRDVSEAFEVIYNPIINSIPQDEYGIQEGTFKVVITWEPEA